MNEEFIASFNKSDWQKITTALKTYVIQKEEYLKTRNVGDREWNEVDEYNVLINDIELYVLGGMQ